MSRIVAARLVRLVVPFRTPLRTAARHWTERRLGLVVLVDADGRQGLGELAADDAWDQPIWAAAELEVGALVGREVAEAVEAAEAAEAEGLVDAISARQAGTRAGTRVGTRVLAAAISTAGLDLRARTAGRTLAAELGAWLDRQPDGGSPGARQSQGASGTSGPSVAGALGVPRVPGVPGAFHLPVAGWSSSILPSVRVNALVGGDSTDERVRAALVAVGRGSTCLKLKAIPGVSARALVESMRAVRDAVGPSVQLRLDANGVWTEEQAVDYVGALADPWLDLEYVEQPVSPEIGLAALGRIRRAARVPIAADESVLDLAAAERLLAANAVDVLVVKLARVGGPIEAVRIARLAQAHGVPTVLSTLFETGVGLAAALHVAALLPGTGPAHGLDTVALLADDLVLGDLRPVEGRLTLPPGPGLGVAIDEAAVERYRLG